MSDSSAKSRLPAVMITIPVVLAFIYFYPRLLIDKFGEANPWTSYLYQYGFGLIVFLIGIYVIRRSGSCRPGRGYDRLWFGVLIGGFLFFAIGHALWIVAAQQAPYLGSTP